MMVMLGSQPRTPVLCQVVAYPPLKEGDEHKGWKFSYMTVVSHPLIEDVSYSDECIDNMKEIVTI